MDSKYTSETVDSVHSLEDSASLWSRWVFTYLNPMLTKGDGRRNEKEKELLTLSDLGPSSEQDRCAALYERFQKHWNEEQEKPSDNRSLWLVVWRTVGYVQLVWALALYALFYIASFGPIIILNKLVKHFSGSIELSVYELWTLAALVFIFPALGGLCSAQSNVIMAHIGLKFRNTLINAIHRKSLRLSSGARTASSSGQIVNMFSNDTVLIQRFVIFLNISLWCPPAIIIALVLVYQQVGVAMFAGLALIVISMPISGVIFSNLARLQRIKMVTSDMRVKLVNELLNGIRIVKFYAWESAFMKKITAIREREVRILGKLAYLMAVGVGFIMQSIPVFMPVTIFLVYTVMGNSLDSATAYTTIALLNFMQFPFLFIPLGLAQYSASAIAVHRIMLFLQSEELTPYVTDESVVVTAITATADDAACIGPYDSCESDDYSGGVSNNRSGGGAYNDRANCRDSAEAVISMNAACLGWLRVVHREERPVHSSSLAVVVEEEGGGGGGGIQVEDDRSFSVELSHMADEYTMVTTDDVKPDDDENKKKKKKNQNKIVSAVAHLHRGDSDDKEKYNGNSNDNGSIGIELSPSRYGALHGYKKEDKGTSRSDFDDYLHLCGVKEDEEEEVEEVVVVAAVGTLSTVGTAAPRKQLDGGPGSTSSTAAWTINSRADDVPAVVLCGGNTKDVVDTSKPSLPFSSSSSSSSSSAVANSAADADPSISRSVHTLNDLAFSVKKGELLAIVGPVGCGKSSVLGALIGEMYCHSGDVNLHGTVAYCSQQAWILSDTVMNNILFGKAYDEEAFDEALSCTHLEDDLVQLEGGVNTQIGEKGVNVSGGQKARIALARAVYANTDIYLLDDPLSAVDAHVGDHLFRHCVLGALKGKTRVMVTHHVHLLPQCDKVLVLDDRGRMVGFGTFLQLVSKGIDFKAVTMEENENAATKNVTAAASSSSSFSSSSSSFTYTAATKMAVTTCKMDLLTLKKSAEEDDGNDNGNDNEDDDAALSTESNVFSLNSEDQLCCSSDDTHELQPLSTTATTTTTTIATIASTTSISNKCNKELLLGGQDITTGSDDIGLEREMSSRKRAGITDSGKRASRSSRGSNNRLSVGSTDIFEFKRTKELSMIRKLNTKSSTIISVDKAVQGRVEYDVYWYYVKSGGICVFVCVLLAVLLSQGFLLLSSFWLSRWGDDARNDAEGTAAAGGNSSGNNNTKNGDKAGLSTSQSMFYVGVFALLSFVGLLLYMLRSILLAKHRVQVASVMHGSLLKAVVSGSSSFFDVTPAGRLLNKFSGDFQVVDEELAQTINQVVTSLATVLGALAAVAGATKGTFLVLIVPLLYVYKRLQSFFRCTNTAIARLESLSRSPIYTALSQVLAGGMISVRAYNSQSNIIRALEELVDANSIANIMHVLIAQWLAVRLDLLGSAVSCFVAVVAVSTRNIDFIPPGFLALGLAYSFQLTIYLKFLVRVVSTAEAQMNSVENIKGYIDTIEPEEAAFASASSAQAFTVVDHSDTDIEAPPVRPVSTANTKKNYDCSPKNKAGEEVNSYTKRALSPYWPTYGGIEVRSVDLRYRDGPLVLKNLNFSILPMEKIGVVGRTGCGKSSLLTCVFRMHELSGGCICIDGVDIASVPLRTLRSQLGIVPQEPTVFTGSVRFNMDPFGQFFDSELWNVLDRIQLKQHVQSLPNSLDEELSEGGDQFSSGQRQLLCIARAVLRKPKILILDEATASIDNDTDELVQRIIREQFKDCTVLTVAHRLHTVLKCDKILVLDAGECAEFDTPQKLLEDPHSQFHAMWAQHAKTHTQRRSSSTGTGSNNNSSK